MEHNNGCLEDDCPFHLGDFHMLIFQCVLAVGSEPQVVLHMFSL